MSLCRKTKINAPLTYEVLNKDVMKSEIMHHLSAAKRGCLSKNELAGAIQCILYKPKTGCQR